MVMNNQDYKNKIALKAQSIREKYYFEYNEFVSLKLSQISNLNFRTISFNENKIFFSNSSPDKKQKEVVVTDREYNILNRYDTSKNYPWEINCITSYNEYYIVCGVTGDVLTFYPKIFASDFNFLCELPDMIPFFKDKQIISAQKDDKGGMYFCEPHTGVLHYMNNNGQVSSFQSDFKMPFQISYFDGKLYITDLFKTLNLKQGHNVSIFKDNTFYPTGITGESICFSSETGTFFVSSGLIEKCIRKYDLNSNLIFTKDFEFDEDSFTPSVIAINKNNLIACMRNARSPIVYDIY